MGKDYAYRGTWKHKFSRALNKARRGGMSKKEALEKKGRLPKGNEWWNNGTKKEWVERWKRENPKPLND